jgi:hypothetical protein
LPIRGPLLAGPSAVRSDSTASPGVPKGEIAHPLPESLRPTRGPAAVSVGPAGVGPRSSFFGRERPADLSRPVLRVRRTTSVWLQPGPRSAVRPPRPDASGPTKGSKGSALEAERSTSVAIAGVSDQASHSNRGIVGRSPARPDRGDDPRPVGPNRPSAGRHPRGPAARRWDKPGGRPLPRISHQSDGMRRGNDRIPFTTEAQSTQRKIIDRQA